MQSLLRARSLMDSRGASLGFFVVVSCTFAVLFSALDVFAQAPPVLPSIVSPTDGQDLQGQIQVRGTTDIPGYSSTEVAFAYTADQTGTWFLIQSASVPASNAALAVWDTTSITDGDYVLRLRVILLDGSAQDATVSVHVRNYSAVPTPSPAAKLTQPASVSFPTAMIVAPPGTPTLAATPAPATPTALPPNPAGFSLSEVYSGFWRGALLVGILIVILGVLIRFRR